MNKYNKKLRADNIIIEFKHRADQLEKLKESAVEASEVFDLNEVITTLYEATLKLQCYRDNFD
jgi:hypothetical protein